MKDEARQVMLIIVTEAGLGLYGIFQDHLLLEPFLLIITLIVARVPTLTLTSQIK